MMVVVIPVGAVGLFAVVLVLVIALILLLTPGGISRYFKEIKTKNGGPDCSCDLPEIPWQLRGKLRSKPRPQPPD